MIKAIVFDTETTGFDKPEIIEAAWMVLSDNPFEGNIEHADGRMFHSRFKPSKDIDVGAMAVHHILSSDLVDCRPSESFVLPEVEYVVGHNVDYDMGLISYAEGVTPPKRICTLALSRHLFPGISHSQGAVLYHLLGARARPMLQGAHNALVDVTNCLLILKQVIALKNLTTWEEIYALSEVARVPTVMAFGKHKGTLITELPKDYIQWFLKQIDIDPYLEKALRLTQPIQRV